MKETKSELKLSAAYLLILAGWLWGIDIQQIALLLTNTEQYTRDLRELVNASAGKDLGAVVGGLVAAVYSIARTVKKINAD
jgi:hypothetical protein